MMFFRSSRLLFVLIFIFVLTGYTFAATEIQLSTHKISPNEHYQVFITCNGSGYSGRLDYELYKCDLDFTNLIHVTDEWLYEAIDGVATTEPNQNIPAGLYLVRFKPHGAADNEFSDFEILMVDDQPTLYPIVYSEQTIPLPPPGSYMIFESYNSRDQFVGYTRIDIETDQAPFGGHAMRMTKTAHDAYWNAGWPNVIRFGIDKITSNDPSQTQWIVSPGWAIYSSNTSLQNLAQNINVYYQDNGLFQSDRQGLLGGYPLDSSHQITGVQNDMKATYSLLPPNGLVPESINTILTPRPCVELAVDYNELMPGTDIVDLWHTEVRHPTTAEGVLTMRYVESGAQVNVDADSAILRWSVSEDWVWRADGLIDRITQWTDVDPLCWRGGSYDCETSGQLLVDARLIDWYIPTDQPLTISFRDTETGISVDHLEIQNSDSYEMVVLQHDGRLYSGFLELLVDGETMLWKDVENKPVYVSNGSVFQDNRAFGSLDDFAISLRARPYLINSSINSLYPVEDQNLIENASTAAFSNEISLVIGDPLFYPFQCSVKGGGSVDISPLEVAVKNQYETSVTLAEQLTLTAIAGENVIFSHWTVSSEVILQNPLSLIMDSEKSVVAHFFDHVKGEPFVKQTSETISRNACQISQGVYDSYANRTFIVYPAGLEPSGDISSCDPYIIYYDHTLQTWSSSFKVAESPPYHDSHYCPQILLDSDHYLHVFNSGHVNPIQHLRSSVPCDHPDILNPSNWQTVPFSHSQHQDKATYVYAFQNAQNDMYLLYRQSTYSIQSPGPLGDQIWYEPIYYIKSTDEGNSWSAPQMIIDPGYDSDNWNTIYIKGLRVSKEHNELYLTYGLHYNHNSAIDELFYIRMDLNNDQFYGPAGHSLGTLVTRTDFEYPLYKCSVWKETDTSWRYVLGAVDQDHLDVPHVFINVPDGTQSGETIVHRYWTGADWSEPEYLFPDFPFTLMPQEIQFYPDDSYALYTANHTLDQEFIQLIRWNISPAQREAHVVLSDSDPGISRFGHWGFIQNAHPDLQSTFMQGEYHSWYQPQPVGKWFAWGEGGILANGSQDEYTVSLTVEGAGTVYSDDPSLSCSGAGIYTLSARRRLFLQTLPEKGSFFSHWEGIQGNANANQCDIFINRDYDITAHFVSGKAASSVDAAAIKFQPQSQPTPDLAIIVDKIENALQSNPQLDVLVTPEYSLSRYEGNQIGSPPITFDYVPEERRYVIAPNQEDNRAVPIIRQITNIAKTAGSNIILGTVAEQHQGYTCNSQLIIDLNGNITGIHRKTNEIFPVPYPDYIRHEAMSSINTYTIQSGEGTFFTIFPLIGSERENTELLNRAADFRADLLAYSNHEKEADYELLTQDIFNEQFDSSLHGWERVFQEFFIPALCSNRSAIDPQLGYLIVSSGECGRGGLVNLASPPVPPLSLTVDDDAVYGELLLASPQKQVFAYNFAIPGWYMISIPGTADDLQVSSLFSKIGAEQVYEYSDSYISSSEVEPGKGYWIYAYTSAIVDLELDPIYHYQLNLSSGWQMIGACASAMTVSALTSYPSSAFSSYIYRYEMDSGYQHTDSILPKQGYWTWISEPCEFIVSTGTSKLAKSVHDAGNFPPPPPVHLSGKGLDGLKLPQYFDIYPAYPNPFNAETTIEFVLPKSENITLSIYNVQGKRIRVLESRYCRAGNHLIRWDGANQRGIQVSSGLYLVRFKAGAFTKTIRVLYLR
ncbi:T9SS type A sorting domain-containing protein [candidate division KSB1 bacterium]|nr:T9SS type A sorting domain-containing protein [candidate division KSB1 bacterium]